MKQTDYYKNMFKIEHETVFPKQVFYGTLCCGTLYEIKTFKKGVVWK